MPFPLTRTHSPLPPSPSPPLLRHAHALPSFGMHTHSHGADRMAALCSSVAHPKTQQRHSRAAGAYSVALCVPQSTTGNPLVAHRSDSPNAFHAVARQAALGYRAP